MLNNNSVIELFRKFNFETELRSFAKLGPGGSEPPSF